MAGRPRRDEAASAIIGTMLMIGIMVVLAAVVFVVARGIQVHPEDETPHLVFVPQEDRLVVASMAPGSSYDWFRDLRITGTCAADLQLTTASGTVGAYPTAAGTPVRPGDVLGNCDPGEDIVVSFRQQERILFRHTY
jgi:hypothetical protein